MADKITNVKALEYVVENFGGDLPADVKEKVENILASFRKKSENRKLTANQEANVGIKDTIKAVLADADKPLTVTDIQKANEELGALSNQRVSALLRQLKDEGVVIKATEGKKSVFSLA